MAELLAQYPLYDPHDERLHDLLEALRSRFKAVSAAMGTAAGGGGSGGGTVGGVAVVAPSREGQGGERDGPQLSPQSRQQQQQQARSAAAAAAASSLGDLTF